MPYDEFVASPTYHRMYVKILDPYEDTVYRWLDAHNDLSSAQVYDWLRERYDNLPSVNAKTVFNYVRYIRARYNIEKPKLSDPRPYAKLEQTGYGEYAQVDFGEKWMHYEDGRKVKVYFFAMVPLNKSAALPPGSGVEAYRNLLPDKWKKNEQGQ